MGQPSGRKAEASDTLSLADRFSALVEMTRTIASASERDGVYDAVRKAAINLLRGDQCAVVDVHGRESGSLAHLERLENLSRTLVDQAIEAGGPVVASIGDEVDPTESLVLSGVRSVLCAPITNKEGFTEACFYVTHSQVGGLFGGEEVRLASFIATLAGAALDQVAGSEARFTSLVQNSKDVITIVGAHGLVDYQSASVYTVFGIEPNEMLGSRLAAWIHPDEAAHVEGEIRKMLDEGLNDALVECRLRASNGEWRDIEATMTNLVNDPSVRGVVLNARDVTERKRMEAERQRDEEALRFSEAQLAAAQRIGHFGSFHWDVTTDTLSWSEELHNIFGVGTGDFAGTIADYRTRLHPEDAERVEAVLDDALKKGDIFEMEHRIVRPDGRIVVLSCRGEGSCRRTGGPSGSWA